MVRRDRDLGQAVAAVGQADVDRLALARVDPLLQRREGPDGGVQGGRPIDDRHAGLDRRQVF